MADDLGPAANAIVSHSTLIHTCFVFYDEINPAYPPQRLEWTFGFNKEISGGVHNLSDASRRVSERRTRHRCDAIDPYFLGVVFQAIFYVAGNVGAITDLETNRQVLLQGHVSAPALGSLSLELSQPLCALVLAHDRNGVRSSIVQYDRMLMRKRGQKMAGHGRPRRGRLNDHCVG